MHIRSTTPLTDILPNKAHVVVATLRAGQLQDAQHTHIIRTTLPTHILPNEALVVAASLAAGHLQDAQHTH